MKQLTEWEFREHKEMREELEKLLALPVMQQVLGVVRNYASPRGIPEPRPNAHLDTLTSQKFYHLHGIQTVLDVLGRMTTPNPVEKDMRTDVEDYPFEQSTYFMNLPESVRKAYFDRKQRGEL